MKPFIGEIFDPIKDFYLIRNKIEKRILIITPVFVGIFSFVISLLASTRGYTTGFEFANDIVGQFITILALFISFNMGYLSLIITSSSKNVEDMKTTASPSRFKDKQHSKPFMVYEILTAEITYTLLVEIFFLIVCVAEKMLMVFLSVNSLKIIVNIDIALFVHTAIMLLVIVKNIYYSFWKPI